MESAPLRKTVRLSLEQLLCADQADETPGASSAAYQT